MAIEIFPVVHVHDARQATEQSGLAFESGADGVYLIDHSSVDTHTLVNSFNEVSAQYTGQFIGLNFLQHSSAARSLSFLLERKNAGALVRLPDGLWADNADTERQHLLDLRAEHPELEKIKYLGGVAFKYTPLFTNDPERAAAEAIRLEPFVDVVTTSGAGTGKAPAPEKIEAMKAAINGKSLAVASGISVENFADYRNIFDQLLVSTSVEVEPYSGIFDRTRLKDLIDIAHS